MQNPRLAARYAKSLLDLAVEKNSLDAILKDMEMLDSIAVQSHDFTLMLRSPVISSDKKQSIINEVLKNQKVNAITKAFISLLITKGRESNLPEITQAFIEQYKELKHIRTVKLTTAAPMDAKIKESIMSKISGYMPGDTIDLETSIDETLIGGFVLEVGDKLYDASVKKGLNNIKSSIMDYSYVSKM